MKNFSLLFFTIFTFSLQAQVTIDQVILKIDSNAWDSVYVQYTSNLGELDYVGGVVWNNGGCTIQHSDLMFSGDTTSTSVTKDTTFRVGYFGFTTDFFKLEAIWDTSILILPPNTLIFMDTYIIDSCGLTNILENNLIPEFKLFPNPANTFFKIEKNTSQKISSIEFIDINGKLIKKEHGNKTKYDVSNLKSGLYFIKLSSNSKSIIKKLIITH
jgi:hypothetical protein